MALFRAPPRRAAQANKGFLRTRRPKQRFVPWDPGWMDAAWYSARNELRNRFEALRSGEYSQSLVLNENWMTPTSWYAQKNDLRERYESVFRSEDDTTSPPKETQ
ncbi:MAG: hypothetical protein JNM76_14140 [Betaproteobacteria bacterium]|nr:hypothetical protein [Betaproteobacteria bacterium]